MCVESKGLCACVPNKSVLGNCNCLLNLKLKLKQKKKKKVLSFRFVEGLRMKGKYFPRGIAFLGPFKSIKHTNLFKPHHGLGDRRYSYLH